MCIASADSYIRVEAQVQCDPKRHYEKGGILGLRIDNSGWSVNSSALFDGAGMRWYERKYHVLYTIRQTIINYLLIYFMIR